MFNRSNGWMASHLEKLVLKLMQCGVGREECCSGIKRACCRLPPKRRQSFFLLLFFYRALQWHLESLLQMTLCPRIRKTVGVSLLQVCSCNIPPLCIFAFVQFHDQIVPFQPLFLKLILITSFEYFRSHRILFKNSI